MIKNDDIINVRVPKSVKRDFQKLYPSNLSNFVNSCLRKAIKDKGWTLSILFDDIELSE